MERESRLLHTPESDVAILSPDRPRRLFAPGDILGDGADSPDEIYLFVAGSAVLGAETPFGPHPIATLGAPVLVNLKRALGGSTDLCRVVPDEESEAIVFTADECCRLLSNPGQAGQAFRRLALSSVSTSLREANDALAQFFEPTGSKERRRPFLGIQPAPQGAERPAAPEMVYDLFDAAGLNPSGLPDLGLMARVLPEGTPLMTAGSYGDEAYLIAEGRLRVSIQIPGVGEEALAILGVGEIVGEMALIDSAPRSADVYAHQGRAMVYVLSREVFRRLLETGEGGGAPLLAGVTVVLTRRHEEAIRKAAGFRILAGPFGS